ncbi:T9SS type A sorting domain-containing protein [Candidatus Fermentibacteria bacterium]|nr:T9SS type A sorting domain-containing protein [Candidatus Fermentibacteria bacterium]
MEFPAACFWGKDYGFGPTGGSAMRLLVLTVAVLTTAAWAVDVEGGRGEPLPIGFTEEELTRLDEIGLGSPEPTSPPPDGTRNPGEFEAATGVFIVYDPSSWSFGVPDQLMVDLSNDDELWVICESGSQSSAESDLIAAGVNMSNVSYLNAPLDSWWIRDYGPWFVHLEDGTQAIFNYDYNRPRPNDNDIPVVVGSEWGLDVYTSEVVHTGGNYMSGGLEQAMSTELVYDENGGNQDWVDTQMELYLGIDDYVTMEDPQSSYIDHIDCWGKILSPTRVMVLEVPPSHPDYSGLESVADMLANTQNPYGTYWDVYRVYSSGTEGYSNSLITNDNVYMPTWNTSNDSPAIIAYEEALPGYTVRGYYFSDFSNTDALHCRTRNVIDRYMLWINHLPVDSLQLPDSPVGIDALIRCHPDHSLTSTTVYYRVGTSGSFTSLSMASTGADSFHADIPGQSQGSLIQYYVAASDNSGRNERHPRFAPDTWCHEYQVEQTGSHEGREAVPGIRMADPAPNPFGDVTNLSVSLASGCDMELAVYDLSGRKIDVIYSGHSGAGAHVVSWSPSAEVPNGVYMVRLSSADGVLTRRVTLIR